LAVTDARFAVIDVSILARADFGVSQCGAALPDMA
jgi:hypothetical protein